MTDPISQALRDLMTREKLFPRHEQSVLGFLDEHGVTEPEDFDLMMEVEWINLIQESNLKTVPRQMLIRLIQTRAHFVPAPAVLPEVNVVRGSDLGEQAAEHGVDGGMVPEAALEDADAGEPDGGCMDCSVRAPAAASASAGGSLSPRDLRFQGGPEVQQPLPAAKRKRGRPRKDGRDRAVVDPTTGDIGALAAGSASGDENMRRSSRSRHPPERLKQPLPAAKHKRGRSRNDGRNLSGAGADPNAAFGRKQRHQRREGSEPAAGGAGGASGGGAQQVAELVTREIVEELRRKSKSSKDGRQVEVILRRLNANLCNIDGTVDPSATFDESLKAVLDAMRKHMHSEGVVLNGLKMLFNLREIAPTAQTLSRKDIHELARNCMKEYKHCNEIQVRTHSQSRRGRKAKTRTLVQVEACGVLAKFIEKETKQQSEPQQSRSSGSSLAQSFARCDESIKLVLDSINRPRQTSHDVSPTTLVRWTCNLLLQVFESLKEKRRDSKDFAKKVRAEKGVDCMLQALTLSHSGEDETKNLHEYALGVLYYLTCYDDDASMAFCQTGMTLLLEEIMPKYQDSDEVQSRSCLILGYVFIDVSEHLSEGQIDVHDTHGTIVHKHAENAVKRILAVVRTRVGGGPDAGGVAREAVSALSELKKCEAAEVDRLLDSVASDEDREKLETLGFKWSA